MFRETLPVVWCSFIFGHRPIFLNDQKKLSEFGHKV